MIGTQRFDALRAVDVLVNVVPARDGGWATRHGFGVVEEFDTTLMGTPPTGSGATGLDRVMGAHVVRCPWGATQVLIVARSSHAQAANSERFRSDQSVWHVLVYDLDGRVLHEEPLYRLTQDAVSPTDKRLDQMRAHYQTALDADTDSWVRAEGTAPWWFVSTDAGVVFGSSDAGVWSYRPARFLDVRDTRSGRRQIDRSHQIAARTGYGEAAFIERIRGVKDAYGDSEGLVYLQPYEYPTQTAAGCLLLQRLVLASGNRVWFTQPGWPSRILADDNILVPSTYPVTALAPRADGSLWILTEREAYVYTPSIGMLASQGTLSKVSDVAGAWSCRACAQLPGGQVMVANQSGAWVLGTSATRVDEIASVFPSWSSHGAGIPSPVVRWLDGSGTPPLGTDSPGATYTLSAEQTAARSVQVVWLNAVGAVAIVDPSRSVAFLRFADRWVVWSFQSVTREDTTVTGSPALGCYDNLPHPILVGDEQLLFAVSGPLTTTLEDESSGLTYSSSSIALARYGRGGALDRSEFDEDRRGGFGDYSAITLQSTSAYMRAVWLGEWERLPRGFVLFNGNVVQEEGAAWLLPVSISGCPTTALAIDTLTCSFVMDEQSFALLKPSIGSNVYFQLAAERRATQAGWSVTRSTAGLPAGQAKITIAFNAATAGVALNVPAYGKSDLFWLIIFTDPATCSRTPWVPDDGSGHWVCEVTSGASTLDYSLLAWAQWSIGNSASSHNEDRLAQPVDWAIASREFNVAGPDRVKIRGLDVRFAYRGAADEQEGTTPGDESVAVDAIVDGARWLFQSPDQTIVNVEGLPSGSPAVAQLQEQTARFAVRSSAYIDGEMAPPVYGDSASSATWRGVSTPNDGRSVVAADDAPDYTVTETFTTGRSASAQVFGWIRNRAERMVVSGLSVLYRATGGSGPRRTR